MKKLLYIGNKLSKHGITPTSIETLGPLFEREGFKVFYTSSQKNIYFRMFSMLWSVLLNRRVDYVIIDTYSTTNFWYAFTTSQLCRLLKLKYIPILRGGDLPNRLKKNPIFCDILFKNAYKNIVPSRYLYNSFCDFGFANLIYIPNTIELENYPFLERKKVKPSLLWVRSFAKIYNPKMAVEVFASIKKKYPEATLCMVGPEKDGSLLSTEQKAKDLNLEVLFTSKLSKPEWTSLSENYDIFINTTHFDNTPVSVMEAMSLGLAVVSTNVGGIPFLLEDQKDALLIPDSDVEEMVKAIERLIENQVLFNEITMNARLKSEQFDWQAVKNKWVLILK